MLTGLLLVIVWIVIICVIGGIVKWLIERAPFIPGDLKVILVYLVYLVVALAIIFELLGLVGSSHSLLR